MRNFIKILENNSIVGSHRSIGWDFDNTLIDNPFSSKIHEFINNNLQMRHCIITFRTHGMQKRIFRELARYPDAPPSSVFEAIYNISDDAWADDYEDRRLRREKILTGPLTPAETYYRLFKGETCKKYGYTALVDDSTQDCLLGCEKYGIALYHPDDFSNY